MELVVVNDCSTDRTGQIVEQYIAQHPDASILWREACKNAGKGAALHTAIQLATGDLIVVQDADLEYDPHEFSILLKPFWPDRQMWSMDPVSWAESAPHSLLLAQHRQQVSYILQQYVLQPQPDRYGDLL